MSYSALWLARALAETRSYWTPLRATLTIAGPVITGLLWGAFRPWEGWRTVIQGLLISVVVFFALWGLAVFISLIATPGTIHAEQEAAIAGLTKAISDLNEKPKISAMDQGQRALVIEKLADFTSTEIELVRFLLQHSSVHYDRIVERFGPLVAETGTRKGTISGLILQNHPRYDINVIFFSALQHYFFGDD